MGRETIIIVIPLPSGVMKAPKTKIAIAAYRQFLRHVSGRTMPRAERPYMITGSSKATPKARLKRRMKSRNSWSWKRVSTPRPRAMSYRNRIVKGRRRGKATATPPRKRRTTGTDTRTMSRLSLGLKAGATNAQNSYVRSGEITMTARNIAILNWTTTASHGVRMTDRTSGGIRKFFTATRNWDAMTSAGLNQGTGSQIWRPMIPCWKLNVMNTTNATTKAKMEALRGWRSSSGGSKNDIRFSCTGGSSAVGFATAPPGGQGEVPLWTFRSPRTHHAYRSSVQGSAVLLYPRTSQ